MWQKIRCRFVDSLPAMSVRQNASLQVSSYYSLRPVGRERGSAFFCPHFPELLINLPPSQLPCINLRQALAQLLKFLLNAVLLARSSDPQELIFVGVFAQAKRERVRMVPLQRGAGRYRDKSWMRLLAGRRALLCGYAMRLTDSFAFSSLVEQALHV
jgi:hypothetical protein